MRAIWLCGVLVLAALPVFGQPSNMQNAKDQALGRVCGQVDCRKSTTTLVLRTRDGSTEKFDTQPFPYLDPDGNVAIFPGETIMLALGKNGSGRPRLLKVIDAAGAHEFAKPTASEATVEFQYKQMDGKPDMLLTVQNTTSATLKYDAMQAVMGARGIETSPTSSCPVFAPGPGQAAFGGLEHWPYPIVTLLIQNIRPLDASADRTCK